MVEGRGGDGGVGRGAEQGTAWSVEQGGREGEAWSNGAME